MTASARALKSDEAAGKTQSTLQKPTAQFESEIDLGRCFKQELELCSRPSGKRPAACSGRECHTLLWQDILE